MGGVEVNTMDIGPLVIWAAGISTLLSLGTTIWTMLTSGARKNDTRIAETAAGLAQLERATTAKLGEIDRHLQRHDDQFGQMPSIEMMHRLELSLTRLDGHIGKIDERLKPVTAIAERMQELMIEQAKGK